ncbi:hypothetical protein [Streptomyces sp. NPDC057287]|uniref:hypothetical protein n=1 Tax=Streptomyces sp. NPDC057287 TaxID=3346086 RepID=UPI00362FB769
MQTMSYGGDSEYNRGEQDQAARRTGLGGLGPIPTLGRNVPAPLQDPDAPEQERTLAHDAAALALKRTLEATAADVLEIGLFGFGAVIEPKAAASVLAASPMSDGEPQR